MRRVTELSVFLQQRINIHFCVQLDFTLKGTKEAIKKVFGVVALSDKQIGVWYRQFQSGRTTIVDLERKPKPRVSRSPANIAAVKDCVDHDRRATLYIISKETGIPRSSVFSIVKKDLQLVKKCAKYVPRLLTPAHMAKQHNNSEYLLRLFRNFPKVMERTVTMDESWVYMYNPLRKEESREWLHKEDPRPIKAQRARATGKVLIITFFDTSGLIYYEFYHKTIKKGDFIQICGRFLDAFETRRPRGRFRGCLFLHMDNAQPHTAGDSMNFLRSHQVQVLPHAPYSPDLAPNNFWFYGRLKGDLRGVRFPDIPTLKDAVRDQIGNITSMEYCQCIMKTWVKRLISCITANGGYFEGIQ